MSTRTKRLLEMLDAGTKEQGGADRALYLLLKRYESDLPELDERFHKSFRQFDVTNGAETDMAIWHLLRHSEVFWVIFNKITAQEPAMQTSASTPFAVVPETTLPDGSIVPAFQVGRYLCSRSADGRAQVIAGVAPWVEINYRDAVQACRDAGFALITERQALALAWNVAQQAENWTGGAVGEGTLRQGLHKWSVNSAQPGTYESPDPDERRWFVLSNGERVFDVAGNAFTWIRDDVQGDADGLIARAFAADSISLQAPYPSLEKGMGWRPEPGDDWSGRALIRGGSWYSGRDAGAFYLSDDWPGGEWGYIGFRCTLPIGA